MKINFTKSQRASGSVLIVTVVIASLFGMFLFYYLNVVASQRTMVARSQSWNLALSYAEAGAEEVLAHLNPGAPQPIIDRTTDGWGSPVANSYGPMQRSFSSGSYSVSFTDDRWPVIYSTGRVTIASIPATLTRVVRLTTTNAPLFNAALAVKLNINFQGNGVATDSFDSSNPAFSTNGRYDASKASTNGSIASTSGLINVGNGDVNGAVLLGPTATDTLGSQGTITGGVKNDFNYEFEDVILPPASWLSAMPAGQMIDDIFYQVVYNVGGDYTINNLNSSIYVGPGANVRLLLTGNASPQYIQVATGGSLTIYMTGSSFTLSGSSSLDGGVASALSYYGLPSNTSVILSGNASFTGTIYAPEADISIGGGGSNTYDFVGAIVARSAKVNGHFNFHFDEALWKNGPMRPYVPNSWAEL